MIEYYFGDNTLCLYITGEIDHHSCEPLRNAADELINRLKPREVKIDLRDVTFCDSSGIAFVLGRYKLLKSLGGEVKLVNVPPQPDKVFRLAAVNKLIESTPLKSTPLR